MAKLARKVDYVDIRQCLILATLFIKALYHCALFINVIENI